MGQRSAEDHEHKNKKLKGDGQLTSRHKIGDSSNKHSAPLTIVGSCAVRMEATKHTPVPMSRHEVSVVLHSHVARKIDVDD